MDEFIAGLVSLAILVAVFIIFRAAVLWYWKLDKIEEHLSAIRKSLEHSKGEASSGSGSNPEIWK
jgi:hypothetical protein